MVSPDPRLLREDLGGAKPGEKVLVGRLGNRIGIELADDDPGTASA